VYRSVARWVALLLAGLCACGGPSVTPSTRPVSSPADIPRFELSIDAALAYFDRFAMDCMGPDQTFADPREWLCVQDNITSVNTVRIIADSAGVSQIIGVSEGASADETISFLLGVVASAVISEAEGEPMLHRAVSRPRLRGSWHLDSAAVELQAHSEARAIIIDPPGLPGSRLPSSAPDRATRTSQAHRPVRGPRGRSGSVDSISISVMSSTRSISTSMVRSPREIR
jgi:hypothetical protein